MAEAAVEGAPDLGPGVVDAVLVTDLCGRVEKAVHVRGVSAFYSYIMDNLFFTMYIRARYLAFYNYIVNNRSSTIHSINDY